MKTRALVRTGHAPQNLSLLRRIAINALNLEQSFKRSNRQKSNRAATDNNYMLTILAACLCDKHDASKGIGSIIWGRQLFWLPGRTEGIKRRFLANNSRQRWDCSCRRNTQIAHTRKS